MADKTHHRNLLHRVLSAIVLVPLAVGALYAGGWYFWALTLLFSILATVEYYGIIAVGAPPTFFALISALPLIVFGLSGVQPDLNHLLVSFAVVCGIAGGMAVVLGQKSRILALIGPVYTILPLMCGVLLRNDDRGIKVILYLLAVVWGTDIGGYLFGRLMGGPKLAPMISPAKTWAGAIGGLGTACILGALVVLIMPGQHIYGLLALIPILSVISQIGDLMESALKRHYGVKDSGSLIPGHGGALDRIDGLLLVALVYSALHFGLIGDWW